MTIDQNSEKFLLDFNRILNFVSCIPFKINFVPSELLSVNIKVSKSN